MQQTSYISRVRVGNGSGEKVHSGDGCDDANGIQKEAKARFLDGYKPHFLEMESFFSSVQIHNIRCALKKVAGKIIPHHVQYLTISSI